ncbi:hypothetical protein PCANC_28786 [Puccinia coronata f. sp. avenae]|uniref:Threonylcarbamoyl-AMP synthase n=1 Tax=Puccinia coronata f. sp. avenae TaxID=200324 RepID=A0A2N5TJT0_9BASI|nr:hypothetical protein PCANC_28786 [Puccinia coronata f. sp. avenae]
MAHLNRRQLLHQLCSAAAKPSKTITTIRTTSTYTQNSTNFTEEQPGPLLRRQADTSYYDLRKNRRNYLIQKMEHNARRTVEFRQRLAMQVTSSCIVSLKLMLRFVYMSLTTEFPRNLAGNSNQCQSTRNVVKCNGDSIDFTDKNKGNPCLICPQKAARIQAAAQVIQSEDLVAFPTETVYGLGASALFTTAVSKIFRAKGRPLDNPPIVHVSSLDLLRTFIPPD